MARWTVAPGVNTRKCQEGICYRRDQFVRFRTSIQLAPTHTAAKVKLLLMERHPRRRQGKPTDRLSTDREEIRNVTRSRTQWRQLHGTRKYGHLGQIWTHYIGFETFSNVRATDARHVSNARASAKSGTVPYSTGAGASDVYRTIWRALPRSTDVEVLLCRYMMTIDGGPSRTF